MTDSGDKANAPAKQGASDNETPEQATRDEPENDAAANPPRTTSFGWLTVPKFAPPVAVVLSSSQGLSATDRRAAAGTNLPASIRHARLAALAV
jgi:hypothetical protein